MSTLDPRLVAVHEVLDAYLALVEDLDLCPWAMPARTGGELRIAIAWWRDGDAEPGVAALVARLVAHTRAWDADPGMRVGLLVVPDLPLPPAGWRQVRDALAARAPRYVLAEFHPDATYVADTPDRLVPLFRRSPDPLLQLVPHDAMKALSRVPTLPTLAEQAAIMADPYGVPPPPPDPRDRIAQANFATTHRIGVEVVAARYAALQAQRRARYAEVGIALPPPFA